MKLRFKTSLASGPFSFLEGQTIEIHRPTPEHLNWLRQGIVEAVRETADEVALAPAAVEQAVTRRGAARGKRAPRRLGDAPPITEGDMSAVPLLCPGGTVVCIGGGPSLTQEDVDACRGKAKVIAINNAYQLAPWADALYACDAKWWRWHPEAAAFAGLKFGLAITNAVFPPEVRTLERTGDVGLEVLPTGLRTGKNGGYQAINVAVHMGATRILLLGYDMQRTNGTSHWFGEHPDGIAPPLESFLPPFETLVEPLKQLGVTVINCSRETALTTFPRMPLATALVKRRAA